MYEKEKDILEESKKLLERKDIDLEALKEGYLHLLSAFEGLLDDTQFVTRVSDRLHKKLNRKNDELHDKTNRLEKAQNVIVQQNEKLISSKENLEFMVGQRTRELEEANEELRMANTELDNFAYKAHHDLKGPIARIMGLCYVAKRDIESEDALHYFGLLQNNAELMQEVMRRLLSINRLRNLEVEFEPFELSAIVQKLEKLILQNSREDVIHVEFKHGDFRMNSDIDFFEALLSNMLEYALRNSKQSSEQGASKKYHIIFNFLEQDSNLQIYISYNGEHIPNNISENIFDLFHRTNNHPQHTGMELYTAKLSAKKLNATIELISSSDKETVFGIFLPKVIA